METIMPIPKDAIDVVWRFFDALVGEDNLALVGLLTPNSDAALMHELFGATALVAASAMLRGPCVIRMRRALVLNGGVWLEGEQVRQETNEVVGYVVFHVERFNNQWRISEILPWHLEAVHYLTERPDPRTDDSVAIILLSVGLTISERAQLDYVEQRLVQTMHDEHYPVNVITRAVRLWRDFRERGDATAYSDATWAAAVHRAMSLLCLLEEPAEQFALMYQTVPDDVANAYNALIRALEITYFDHRYSPIPDPNELLKQAKRAGTLDNVELMEPERLPEEPIEPPVDEA